MISVKDTSIKRSFSKPKSAFALVSARSTVQSFKRDLKIHYIYLRIRRRDVYGPTIQHGQDVIQHDLEHDWHGTWRDHRIDFRNERPELHEGTANDHWRHALQLRTRTVGVLQHFELLPTPGTNPPLAHAASRTHCPAPPWTFAQHRISTSHEAFYAKQP